MHLSTYSKQVIIFSLKNTNISEKTFEQNNKKTINIGNSGLTSLGLYVFFPTIHCLKYEIKEFYIQI